MLHDIPLGAFDASVLNHILSFPTLSSGALNHKVLFFEIP
jgi:hypothetical protein